MTRYLVTGGAGFIGAHVVAQLRDAGDAVRVLDLDCGRVPQGAERMEGSVCDPDAARRAAEGAECVIHLAANAHLWSRDKSVFGRINLGGAQLMLDAAREAGARRFVYVSSLTVLVGAHTPRGPSTVDETAFGACGPMLGPYAASKAAATALALSRNAPNFETIAVLPTLPLGPGDYGMTAPSRMVADLVGGKTPATIDCILNIVDVRDAAAGIIAAATAGRTGEAYILGGENFAMRDFLARLGAVSGRPMPAARVPYALALAAAHVQERLADWITRRPPAAPIEGVRLAGRLVSFDASRARRDLGFRTRPLEETLRDALDWMRDEKLIDAG